MQEFAGALVAMLPADVFIAVRTQREHGEEILTVFPEVAEGRLQPADKEGAVIYTGYGVPGRGPKGCSLLLAVLASQALDEAGQLRGADRFEHHEVGFDGQVLGELGIGSDDHDGDELETLIAAHAGQDLGARYAGHEILTSMRRDERLKLIPVVVVTAYSERLAENLAVEPDLVMLKPVSATQLTGLVQRLAGEKPLRSRLHPFQTPWDTVTGVYNRAFLYPPARVGPRRPREAVQGAPAPAEGNACLTAMKTSAGSMATQRAGEFLHAHRLLLEDLRPLTDRPRPLEPDRFLILIEQAPALVSPEMIAARIQHALRGPPSEPAAGSVTCNIGVLLCRQPLY